MKQLLTLVTILFIACSSLAQPNSLKDQYQKVEKMIPMRDGIKLFTNIFIPKNQTEKSPFLIVRTPYSCSPYGEQKYPRQLGPSQLFANEKYIYVLQDVRGRYMSQGTFEEMTPYKSEQKPASASNESTDCFDTIDWLLKNIDGNNGNAGLYGISYPGFYASSALPGAHPALKAVSPQAPVTDEFEGDDAYHRGAFFLMDNFSFMNDFDHPRDTPWMKYPSIFEESKDDAYAFYLRLGPLKNANTYFYNKSKIWNEYLEHDTKDAYWQARDIRQHLSGIKPAVLVVGGWFDAEDLFGALKTYEAIEKKSPGNNNKLIMGPWTHGSWSRSEWSKFASLNFGENTNKYYQQKELEFFNFYLKGKGKSNLAEATVFETGSNKWKEYSAWPPKEAVLKNWYLNANHQLSFTKATAPGNVSYTSDPANPVPYINTKGSGRNNEYMAADQTFASERADVISFTSPVLQKTITVSGPVSADLFITTTSTDADFIVKVIDVLPADAMDASGKKIGGMQRLVRAEVLRGKFRNSFTIPEPFKPGQVTNIKFNLNDVAHSFLAGHQIMIQVQSSWFPLVDRNPQKFMSIPKAEEKDFQKATIKVYYGNKYPSQIKVLTTE
ncbi:MAG: CocE/NonD family hydrolase [Chitinophagaceae bacterium]|nr:CocE/NonD family hydrolase [Chitinophagaceae bacterium]